MDTRTAEWYSKPGNTDVTDLVVIEETTQCEKVQRTQCKGKVFLHMWFNSAGVIRRMDEHVERNNSAGNDSLKRFAVANEDKRSGMARQS